LAKPEDQRVEDAAVGTTQQGMRVGAVVMTDALGFKGIWKRVPVPALCQQLRDLVELIEEDVRSMLDAVPGALALRIETRFISDTVVFGIWHELPFGSAGQGSGAECEQTPDTVPVHSLTVQVAAILAALVQQRGAAMATGMAFRGAVAFGEFLVDGNFLIGPAIDEAAQNYEIAKAAVVLCLPSAMSELAVKEERSPIVPGLIVDGISVPLGGAELVTAVVNPLASSSAWANDLERLLKPLRGTSAPDVVAKLENTQRIHAAIAERLRRPALGQ
jgi:hypothetical protein